MYARKSLLLLAVVLLLPLLFGLALAQPQIVQTDCDTISTEPVKVKITFAIVNSDPNPVGRIRLIPKESVDPPSTGCGLYDSGSPDSWFRVGSLESLIWEADAEDANSSVEQGETLDGFSITVTPEICCYQVNYYVGAILEPFYWETYCFACDRSVQARPETWGRLKVLYR